MSSASSQHSSAEIDAVASDWIIRRDAGLSDADRVEFENWQASDPRHAATVARFDRAWSRLDRPRSGGRADEMAGALARRAERGRRKRAGVALLAMLLVGSAGVGWKLHVLNPAPRASTAMVITPETRTLPDGTVVELKQNTDIAFDYSGPLRRVALSRGEAVFHVAKNKDRPFVVTAAGVDVRAVGTAFLVGVDTALVDVIVTEGIVAVHKASGPGPTSAAPAATSSDASPPTLVGPGRRLTVDLAGNGLTSTAVEISPDETADRLSWRTPRLDFSHTPLADAVALINQHSRVHLVIDDPDLGKLPVSGLFRADNAETLVRLLEANFGVQASAAGDTIVLRKAP